MPKEEEEQPPIVPAKRSRASEAHENDERSKKKHIVEETVEVSQINSTEKVCMFIIYAAFIFISILIMSISH